MSTLSVGKIIRVEETKEKYDCNTKYIGYKIYLENEINIELKINNTQKCNETFYIFLYKTTKNIFNRNELQNILEDITEEDCDSVNDLLLLNIKRCEYIDWKKYDKHVAGFILEFEEFNCVIGLVNIHNGCYHNFMVNYNSAKMISEL